MTDRVPPQGSDDSDSVDPVIRGLLASSSPGESPPPPDLRLGEVALDRFRVDRMAGRGGMGSVYRAIDLETGLPVALKVVAVAPSSGAPRFVREISVLADLEHPAIVRYVGHGWGADGVPLLAMEWLDGEELSTRLGRGPLTPNEALALARRVADGLAFAHARGVVHRDIKPSNLFLPGCDPRAVKILDFGVARIVGSAGDLTRTGAVLGTVGYMAPEQAMGEKTVGPQADLFSLGCVLFECLTGGAPFTGKNGAAALNAMLQRSPPEASTVRPALGSAFDALLRRVLARNPEDRPRDATALGHALDELLEPGLSSGS